MEMLNPKVKELMNKRVIQGNIKHVITFRMVFQTKKKKVTIKKLAWLTKQMVLTDLRTSKGKESKPSINKLICQDIIATKTKWNETMVNDIYWSDKSTVSKFQTAMTISIILDTEENLNQFRALYEFYLRILKRVSFQNGILQRDRIERNKIKGRVVWMKVNKLSRGNNYVIVHPIELMDCLREKPMEIEKIEINPQRVSKNQINKVWYDKRTTIKEQRNMSEEEYKRRVILMPPEDQVDTDEEVKICMLNHKLNKMSNTVTP